MQTGTTVLALLVLAVTINYIDRGVLSVSGAPLMKELSLDNAQYGLLLSAFFWTYATAQLLAGTLVDRYPVKWVYAVGFLIWSLATAAVGLIYTFPILFAARLVLGLGESVAFPATGKVIVRDFPESGRGFANALVDAGTKVGPGLSTLFGGLAVAAYGWRNVFIIVGVVSLLWLVPWAIYGPSTKRRTDVEIAADGPSVSWAKLLRHPAVWITSFGMFTYGYTNYFMLTWLPTYLVKGRGFSMQEMATLGSIPYWTMAASSLLSGWSSDMFIRAGYNASKVRKTYATLGLLLCGIAMFAVPLASNAKDALLLIIAACAAIGMYSANVWAITQTLAGIPAAGRWTGFQNFIANFGGVLSPLITGQIVQATGSFQNAFWLAAAILALGVITYIFILKKIEPVAWTS